MRDGRPKAQCTHPKLSILYEEVSVRVKTKNKDEYGTDVGEPRGKQITDRFTEVASVELEQAPLRANGMYGTVDLSHADLICFMASKCAGLCADAKTVGY